MNRNQKRSTKQFNKTKEARVEDVHIITDITVAFHTREDLSENDIVRIISNFNKAKSFNAIIPIKYLNLINCFYRINFTTNKLRAMSNTPTARLYMETGSIGITSYK